MSAYNVTLHMIPYALSAFRGDLTTPSPVTFELREGHSPVAVRRELEDGSPQGSSFLRECWRRMGLMKLAFEHAQFSDGTGSRERSAERRRDEDDWSRMDDEGCPNEGLQPMAARTELSRRELVTHVG